MARLRCVFPAPVLRFPVRLSVALLTICALAGCAQSSPQGPADGGPAKPKVNRVVMAVTPPNVESNELRQMVQTELWALRPMYEYLIGVDVTTGKLQPQLATRWSVEPDGRSWRFLLKEGVQFHRGYGEFTAEDVAYAWKDIVQEDSVPQYATYYRALVENVSPKGKYEVVFENRKPDGNFLQATSEREAGFEIRSKAHFAAAGVPGMAQAPLAGTGPYAFDSRQQGAYVRYKRTEGQHWRTTPDFPEFEFRWQKEASTRLAGLLAGETHVVGLPDDLLRQAEQRGFKVKRAPVAGLRTFIGLNCCFLTEPANPASGYRHPTSPLLDVRVRRALNKAINRNEMNKAFFAGKAEVMVLNHFHPSRSGWNPEWERQFAEEYGYNPEKAKQLLAEAGYGPGKPFQTNLHLTPAAGVSGSDDITEAVANYWRAVGVEVNLLTIDPVQRSQQARQFRYSNDANIVGTGSAQLLGVTFYNSGLQNQSTGVQDIEVNAILQKIYLTLEEEKQEPLWRELGNLMFKKHLNVQLFWLPAEVVYNSEIVSDYQFPGNITGLWTHVYNIKAAR